MSWEIKINWDECPYLTQLSKDVFKCEHISNKGDKYLGIRICNKRTCPLKI